MFDFLFDEIGCDGFKEDSARNISFEGQVRRTPYPSWLEFSSEVEILFADCAGE
jgi:hypothetical protein